MQPTSVVGPTFIREDQPPTNNYDRIIQFNLDNTTNDRSLIGLAGVAGDGVTPLYWVNPGRSVFFTISASS